MSGLATVNDAFYQTPVDLSLCEGYLNRKRKGFGVIILIDDLWFRTRIDFQNSGKGPTGTPSGE